MLMFHISVGEFGMLMPSPVPFQWMLPQTWNLIDIIMTYGPTEFLWDSITADYRPWSSLSSPAVLECYRYFRTFKWRLTSSLFLTKFPTRLRSPIFVRTHPSSMVFATSGRDVPPDFLLPFPLLCDVIQHQPMEGMLTQSDLVQICQLVMSSVQNPGWLMISSGFKNLPNTLGIILIQERGIPLLTNQYNRKAEGFWTLLKWDYMMVFMIIYGNNMGISPMNMVFNQPISGYVLGYSYNQQYRSI